MDTTAVIGTVVVTIGGIIAALFTRRSSKDTTAVGGFTELTKGLQQTLKDEAARTTAAIARIDHLERIERRRRELARRHEDWDRKVLVQLRQLTTDPIPDPPPLDTWEDDR